jgi:hypothetical protein
MTTQRLNMLVVLMTLLVLVGFAGCQYHGHGFVIDQLGTACNECSSSDNTLHNSVDRTSDSHHFSVTPNAAPFSQSTKGVITPSPSPSSNRDSGEPPLLVPQPSLLVPVEKPRFQLLPPNPSKLPAVTRTPFFPGQKGMLNLVPATESEPLEPQQRLGPHATKSNGLIQTIKNSFHKLFSRKQVPSSSTASVAQASRRTRSLSRHRRPKGPVSQKRIGKRTTASKVAVSRTSKGADKTNSRNTIVRVQQKNPVSLQAPQPIQ